ncbi:helicase associated domain-containing protein [Streptomyces sp. NPDC051020]|uniref:helicase associated domain-containing protein n=1 Tax=Streptomyces sp. NPDC051020 TaxID=3155409 RepID=UPI00342A82D1
MLGIADRLRPDADVSAAGLVESVIDQGGADSAPKLASGANSAAQSHLEEIVPSVTLRGDDIGRWLTSQARDWTRLNPEQQRRLSELGVKPSVRPSAAHVPRPARTGAGRGADAFQRGLQALTQYIARERKTVVPRGHTEHLEDGTSVRLGVFLSNQKSRRHRLTQDQLAALANLGLHWA